MSEDRFKNIENELRDMRKAQAMHHEDMLKVLMKLEHAVSSIVSHDDEIKSLRKSSHEYGNKLQEIDALRQRVCKLEAHEELREDELKRSFAKRDDRINNLSRIVYIGTGIVIVLQVVLPIFLLRGGQ